MKPQRKVLKNGLRILAVPMKGNPTVTSMVLVEVGSHYEKKENNGISHFLEHMCFKGTENRPSASDIAEELDTLGSESNAFTWYEMTGYYAKSRTKNFKKILDVVADMYLNPIIPKEELEKEKGVIIEEINMYEDLPMRNVSRLLDQVMYGDQPAGWSVLGTKENIKKTTRDEFVEYRNKHYVAGKTAVIVAGDIKPSEVFKEVEKQFASIPNKKAIKKPKVLQKQKKPQTGLLYKKSEQAHFTLGFRSFPVSDKRATSADVLATILGQGMSSRLFKKLREEMGVCYYVKANSTLHSDCGDFTIASGVDKKRVEEVIGEILKELKRVKKETIDAQELKKAKEFMIGNLLMGVESSDALTNFYGGQEILRQKIKTPEELVREIQKVTANDIQKVARDIFKNKNMNLALIGPFKDKRRFEKLLKVA